MKRGIDDRDGPVLELQEEKVQQRKLKEGLK